MIQANTPEPDNSHGGLLGRSGAETATSSPQGVTSNVAGTDMVFT